MKPTEQMIETFRRAVVPDDIRSRWDSLGPALAEALKDVLDVEPFAFSGYPDLLVYLHPSCGTVADVPRSAGEDNLMRAAIDAGLCDCESGVPWLRVYVEKQA